jgi:hypothetical protein
MVVSHYQKTPAAFRPAARGARCEINFSRRRDFQIAFRAAVCLRFFLSKIAAFVQNHARRESSSLFKWLLRYSNKIK